MCYIKVRVTGKRQCKHKTCFDTAKISPCFQQYLEKDFFCIERTSALSDMLENWYVFGLLTSKLHAPRVCIFQQSWESEEDPVNWKLANVPAFRKSERKKKEKEKERDP